MAKYRKIGTQKVQNEENVAHKQQKYVSVTLRYFMTDDVTC